MAGVLERGVQANSMQVAQLLKFLLATLTLINVAAATIGMLT